jgi:hypothetical protein
MVTDCQVVLVSPPRKERNYTQAGVDYHRAPYMSVGVLGT